VTIPKGLLTVDNGCTVLVGYEEVNYTIISNENLTYLYFTYDQGTKTVYIIGTHVIPEFPSALMLLSFIIVTIIAIVLLRKAHLLSDCTLHVFIKPRQRQNSK
jgi:hypothetical protein